MTYGEHLNTCVIDTKLWLSATKELSGKECDLLFSEMLNIYLGNPISTHFPFELLSNIQLLDGLFLPNKEQSGVNHWNWKGGISSENNMIRSSGEYKKWRVSVFFRDNYTCKKCNKKGGNLNAHHIVPFSINKSLRLVLSNGLTLCNTCHVKLHKKEKKWLGVN